MIIIVDIDKMHIFPLKMNLYTYIPTEYSI